MQYIYTWNTTVSVPSSELGPHSLSRKRVCSPPSQPEPKGEWTHSPVGEGVGESQFGRLEKKPSTVCSVLLTLTYFSHMFSPKLDGGEDDISSEGPLQNVRPRKVRPRKVRPQKVRQRKIRSTKGPEYKRPGVLMVRLQKIRKKRSGCKRSGFFFFSISTVKHVHFERFFA